MHFQPIHRITNYWYYLFIGTQSIYLANFGSMKSALANNNNNNNTTHIERRELNTIIYQNSTI